jgi:hypothetical protein
MSSVEAVSKAFACLRVVVGTEGRPPNPALDALVAKLIGAFLETRWTWPRQFASLTPYAFMLTDPRTEELDKQALQALSRELQIKFFGVSGLGEVALLVFEGDEAEIHRFANLEGDNLQKLVNGDAAEIFPPFEGQLSRITAKGSQTIAVRGEDTDWRDIHAVSFATPKFEQTFSPVYRGLYFVPARRFFGNLAMCRPSGMAYLREMFVGQQLLPGVATEEFDEACVESAAAALSQARVTGQLHVLLNFSSLVRQGGRQAYSAFLSRLPEAHKAKLVAAVYETPRDPSFSAMTQVNSFLAQHFGHISLIVSDPAFEIEKLAPGLVKSVNFVLPDQDPPGRIAAIRTFMRNRETFIRKQVWPGIWRVGSRAELDLCIALKAPAVGGSAVSELMASPAPCVPREVGDLPLRPPSGESIQELAG